MTLHALAAGLVLLATATAASAGTTEDTSKNLGYAVLNNLAENTSKNSSYAVLTSAIVAVSKENAYALLCSTPGTGGCPAGPSGGAGTSLMLLGIGQ